MKYMLLRHVVVEVSGEAQGGGETDVCEGVSGHYFSLESVL